MIHLIPNAALAAILIMVGYRLSRPSEFQHAKEIGWEQLAIFMTTLLVTVLVDLLVGVAAGLVAKLLIIMVRGVRPSHLFNLPVLKEVEGETIVLKPVGSIIFMNLFRIVDKIQEQVAAEKKDISVRLQSLHYIDHTSMAALLELQKELKEQGVRLELQDVEKLKGMAEHPEAARQQKHPASLNLNMRGR